MDNKPDSAEDALARMASAFLFGAVPLDTVAREHSGLFSEVAAFDPLRLACSFGGLLTEPSLQSNCVRLEALVHLSLATANGTRKPSERIVAQLFEGVESGTLGCLEDTAEDVFVSLIVTPRGNFRVLEGIWESAGFHTQRVLNALELIPRGPRYDYMRECVYALLKFSDMVCDRAGLTRFAPGNPNPEEKMSKNV